jgi:hypothetical protein
MVCLGPVDPVTGSVDVTEKKTGKMDSEIVSLIVQMNMICPSVLPREIFIWCSDKGMLLKWKPACAD